MIGLHHNVRVEFYGVARLRSGVSETKLDLNESSISLNDLLIELGARYPEFAGECLVLGNETTDGTSARLQRSLTANVDGKRFVRDGRIQIQSGETLLIMSSDAGG